MASPHGEPRVLPDEIDYRRFRCSKTELPAHIDMVPTSVATSLAVAEGAAAAARSGAAGAAAARSRVVAAVDVVVVLAAERESCQRWSQDLQCSRARPSKRTLPRPRLCATIHCTGPKCDVDAWRERNLVERCDVCRCLRSVYGSSPPI
mmetsp:Transcript_24491/g.68107  ORF Transcript_24491/g.68107 Transcript_24491/m.68107 type:complete len:149 (+) Transcript_24491:473-919(+)